MGSLGYQGISIAGAGEHFRLGLYVTVSLSSQRGEVRLNKLWVSGLGRTTAAFGKVSVLGPHFLESVGPVELLGKTLSQIR